MGAGQVTEPLVVNTATAARLLYTSEPEVRRLAHAGEIPHFATPGGQLRFPVEGLREFIARRVEAQASK